MPVRLPSAVPQESFRHEDGFAMQQRRPPKYFGRFPKKAEMEIKIEQGGHPSKSEYISLAASQQQRWSPSLRAGQKSDSRLR
jgi:hypothetical protein